MRVIKDLLDYAVYKGLIEDRDRTFVQNRIFSILNIKDPKELQNITPSEDLNNIDELLKPLIQIAINNGIIDSIDYADLLDTEIMGILSPFPSTVQKTFEGFDNTKNATSYLYDLNINNNYIRMNRVKKNIQWKSQSPVGELDISINVSKPEKDPKLIALEKTLSKGTYPSCLLCKENEGFEGSLLHPARQNIRFIELELNKELWYLQYSPYIYYPEHSIVFSSEHRPMLISKNTFSNLLQFIDRFPHYFIGSNSDIEIVGGSILSHDHYQAGVYEFPIDRANVIRKWQKDNIEIEQIDWVINVIRLRSEDKISLANLSYDILQKWYSFEDHSLGIFNKTGQIRHNAITPIARRRGKYFEIDLVLRNNRTDEQYPMGIFHPHEDKHHIKKENIGLIEVMGLAILPSRLLQEMEFVKEVILFNKPPDQSIDKHNTWIEHLLSKHKFTKDNIDQILKEEIGYRFYEVLSDCCVIKDDKQFSDIIQKLLR